MDLQFHGANCLSITTKRAHLTIDDNLDQLGAKSITKAGDIVLYTHEHSLPTQTIKLLIDSPGEYEVADVSIQGIAMKAYIDGKDHKSTLYKLLIDDIRLVVTGHIAPDLNESELEMIGTVDVLCIPVGGNAYTLDGIGALKLIKKIEPKMIIPTHYDNKALKYLVNQETLEKALKSLAMEPKISVSKLRIKPADLSDVTQLIVLEST